jgi:outer membrane lipoprotein SlyB
MPVDTLVLLDTLSTIARNRNVMVTTQQSMKAGAIAGTSVVLGTMLGGPIGLVLGKIILLC